MTTPTSHLDEAQVRAAALLVRSARRSGVVDEAVLDALAEVPRAWFVPEQNVPQTWLDEPFAIGYGQTTSQPSLIAKMLEMLEVSTTDRVLEVGTGLGYQAALLGRLAGEVYTVELVPELAAQARERLAAAGVTNVHVVCGDGSLGLSELAPFDAIVVAATADEVPDALREQLCEGGRLVLPVRRGRTESVAIYERRVGELRLLGQLGPVRFVPLVRSAAS